MDPAQALVSIDKAMRDTENLKKLTRTHSAGHCVEDCLFHLRRAREALDEGLQDPDLWVKDTHESMQALMTLLPYIILFTHPRYALGNTPSHP
jgi:hypothetical protein